MKKATPIPQRDSVYTAMQQRAFVTHDGIQLAAYHWHNTASSKHIFIAHGLGEHAQRYRHIAELCHAEGFNVHALDQRGHGRSAGQRGHVSQWRNLAHDLQQFIAEYAGTKFLIGHSMGGAVAILYQLLYPGTVNAVALSGPATDISLPLPAWKLMSAAALSKLWPSLAFANEIDPALLCTDPAVVRDYAQDPLVHNRVSARFFSDYLYAIAYIKDQAHTIQTPVAIWHGAEDKIVEPWISADLYARLRCPAKQRDVIAGVYHEILFEKNGPQIATAMLHWFAKIETQCA